jgi:RarD protein
MHLPSDQISAQDYRKGVILVLIAGAMWSIAGLLIRLMENIDEWQILFYRSATLVITMLVYLSLKSDGGLLKGFQTAGLTACLAGLFLGCSFALWIFAITHTTVASALFILSSSPFIAAIFGKILLGEQVSIKTWGLMSVAAAGVAVMVLEGYRAGGLDGNLYALGAAAGFAIFSVILRKGRKNDMTPAVCWAGIWSMLIGFIMVMLNSHLDFIVSRHDLALCAVLGVFQIGLGTVIFTAGSKYLPAAELTLLALTEIILGPLWVWLVIDEVPTRFTLFGGAIVLAAIALQAILGRQHVESAPVM